MPPRKRSLWPTAKAVSPEQAKPSFEDLVRELKSRKEAEERAVWRASGLEPIVRQSAAAAPSAEVSGAMLLGPNLYRKLGGDVDHPMLPTEGSPAWVALEAAGLLPFGRPIRAGAAGVKRLAKLGRSGRVAEEAAAPPLAEGAEKIIGAKSTRDFLRSVADGAPEDFHVVEGLPPVPAGYVRLYRGEMRGSGVRAQAGPWRTSGGLWYSTDATAAHAFAYGDTVNLTGVGSVKPKFLHVDFPKSELAEARARAAASGGAFGESGEVLLTPAQARGAVVSAGRLTPEIVIAEVTAEGKSAFNGMPWLSRGDHERVLAIAETMASRAMMGEGKVAGLLPFGRPLRAGAAGVKRLSRVGRGAKAAEEVGPKTPLPEGAEKITEALPKAKKLYQEQKELRRVELGKRAPKVEEAMMTAEGVEGLHAGLRALQGELPRLTWEGHTQLDQAAVTGLFRHLKTFEGFQTFEKIRAQKGLEKLLGSGRGPTPSEIELLERALGPDVLGQLQSVPRRTLKELALDVLNIPRAMRSSVDVSALFRQALVLGARHPVIWGRDVPVAFKALGSEKYYLERMEELVSRPTYPKMVEAGVRFTDLGQVAGREEAFMSNLAEQIPWLGRVVRASSRSYTGFLNVFRGDAFDHYLRMVETGGKYAPDDPHLLKSIGEWVSTGTGRGTIKSLEDNMVALNFGLFSPRLIASRLQLLNPHFYYRLHPYARRQALRGMAQLLGGISLTLWIAKLNGAEVVMDPRNSDFGKIKLGDTRVDIAGGFQQYLVWAARFIKGETVSSTTGEVKELEGGFGKKSRATLTWDFIENKLAPVPGLGVDAAKGKNFAGDEFDPLKETGRIFLPLNLENTYEGYTEGGPAQGAASLLLGGIGFGTQTYKPNESKRKKRRPHSLWVP